MSVTLESIINLSKLMDGLNGVMMNLPPMSEEREGIMKQWLATQKLLNESTKLYLNGL